MREWKSAADQIQRILSAIESKQLMSLSTRVMSEEQEGPAPAVCLSIISPLLPLLCAVETRTRKRKQRLRSRNHVVDDWLEQEDGGDTFADLEDFLVYD
jgi:hypothetical protein